MITGHRWKQASPSRLTITRQFGNYYLVYQSSSSFERIANWGGFIGIESVRQWVRSQYWPGVIEIVEN
jgi:hypothetical protein